MHDNAVALAVNVLFAVPLDFVDQVGAIGRRHELGDGHGPTARAALRDRPAEPQARFAETDPRKEHARHSSAQPTSAVASPERLDVTHAETGSIEFHDRNAAAQ